MYIKFDYIFVAVLSHRPESSMKILSVGSNFDGHFTVEWDKDIHYVSIL